MTPESHQSPSQDPRALAIWDTFARTGQVADHFSRAAGRFAGAPAWSLIVPIEDEQVVVRAREVQAGIGRAHGAEPIDPERLHVTLDTLALTPPDGWLKDVRSAALRCQPTSIVVGGASAFPESAMLEVLNPEPIRALRQEIRSALSWIDGGVPDDSYLPHVSIAYFGANGDAPDMVSALAGLRTMPPIVAEVRHLLASRLEFDTTGRSRRIESYEIALGEDA
ncbi:MAG: 2'-5' RNA ligase family protein [Tepidiformaceae bacterium]